MTVKRDGGREHIRAAAQKNTSANPALKRAKSTRHGGKGGQNYYFTLSKDGINESVSVDKATYQKYDIGDTIHTRLHSGALGMEYYEYVE